MDKGGGPTAPGRRRARVLDYARTRLSVAALMLCLVSLLGGFGRWHWLLELCAHFPLQYACGLALALVALALLRARRVVLLSCLACLALQVVTLTPTVGPSVAAAPAARPVRALLANVYTRNQDHAALARLLADEDPDLVVLQEVDSVWLAALEPQRVRWPHRLEEPRDDNFGLAVWSRLPLADARIERLGGAGVPTIVARVNTSAGAFRLVATHPLPPAGRERARLRDGQLADLAAYTAAQALPVVVLGDLNCTPWSPRFRDLLQVGRLRDAWNGSWLRATWPAAFGSFGIPLDHCLVSAGIAVLGIRRGPRIGSDHLPVIVEVVLAAGC